MVFWVRVSSLVVGNCLFTTIVVDYRTVLLMVRSGMYLSKLMSKEPRLTELKSFLSFVKHVCCKIFFDEKYFFIFVKFIEIFSLSLSAEQVPFFRSLFIAKNLYFETKILKLKHVTNLGVYGPKIVSKIAPK